MKTWLVVVMGMVSGVALGFGVAWARYGQTAAGDNLLGRANVREVKLQPPDKGGPQPAASISEETFDFGDVETGNTVEHGFSLKNVGAATLRLRKGGTTCGKCTLSELPTQSLEPGETATITVSYNAAYSPSGPFRQTASILTNDAERPRVGLTVSGTVVAALKAVPTEIVFTRISTTEPSSAELRLLAFGAKPLEITGHELLEPDTAKQFRVEMSPLADEELKKASAQSGLLVKITALAGLPTGSLRQKLRLTTNQAKTPTLDVPIHGAVGSDLSVIGRGWDFDKGILSLGIVPSREGLRRQLFVLARGAHRHDVRLKVGHSDPEWIQTEVGQPEIVHQGDVVKWPLTVIVPPGSPGVNRLGSEQGKLGKLILETSLPDAPQVKLYLMFIVEE